MTPEPADGVISVWPNPVINPCLYIRCNVRKRVIFCLITVLGQVLRRETRAQSARCAVLHALHMYSAQYRGCTHCPSRSQRSEITVITSLQLPPKSVKFQIEKFIFGLRSKVLIFKLGSFYVYYDFELFLNVWCFFQSMFVLIFNPRLAIDSSSLECFTFSHFTLFVSEVKVIHLQIASKELK